MGLNNRKHAMKKPDDLATLTLSSAEEHRRRGTFLRRLAGGIEAQVRGPLGLSDQEKALLQAATLGATP